MRLFLELFGVVIMIQLIPLPTVAGSKKVAEMQQLKLWREKLPSVEVPESVAASMSPLTQEEVNTFAKVIAAGNLRFHGTQFCNSANLLCFQSVPVIPIRAFNHYCRGCDFELDEMNDLFFSAEELREGGEITLPKLYSPWKAFLPRKLSQLIPFTTVALSDVVSSFGISKRSNMTQNMNNTLNSCEEKPQQGEIKTCTTSIEGMIEFVLSNLGSSSSSSDNVELVSLPARIVDSGKKARVTKVVERLSGHSNWPPLSCHRYVYPYGVFYCHSIIGTSAYNMELELLEKNGNIYNATSLCHPNLRKKGSVYCHLILGDTLLWLTKDKH